MPRFAEKAVLYFGRPRDDNGTMEDPSAPLISTPAKPVIMAVDDSLSMLKIYERIFSTTKELRFFRLVTFSAGTTAFDWLERNPDSKPAAILLDWNMVCMGGMDVLVSI